MTEDRLVPEPDQKPFALQIETAFTYHAPKADQPARYVQIRDRCKTVAVLMADLCPASRELSLALTKLEESVMWANAAIARHG